MGFVALRVVSGPVPVYQKAERYSGKHVDHKQGNQAFSSSMPMGSVLHYYHISVLLDDIPKYYT